LGPEQGFGRGGASGDFKPPGPGTFNFESEMEWAAQSARAGDGAIMQ
jgi:hypothetical protein